ncbi:dimethylarginine dimethylaminohydrolase family protein [Streptoalloteichus hindustanus]|uniref:N-Dimethylarginine dimethylaminohydrolase n=1 Tax=Streptoalloteichus hindustanus TaxID=2017 RepID=A0A1M5I7M5_STRHI|nr:amidinotransferase [Streptoalloteichus hindustanus]SHG24089.1 N-Dimethylarginine dimethylaminohydrolase [Streptoalloteichus hindustanus]
MTAGRGVATRRASSERDPADPTELEHPAFLVNAPFSYSTGIANIAWREEVPDRERAPDGARAMTQFLELYRLLSAESLVYVLPTPPGSGLRDLVFTADLGVVLEHLPRTAVISRFPPAARRGEAEVSARFFELMGCRTAFSPTRFEGEAELKHLHDNVYAGGHGPHTDRATYDWMEREFAMRVIRLPLTDPRLHHLDRGVFPLTREQTLVAAAVFGRAEIRELEEQTEIIDVPVAAAHRGVCNSVRLHNVILNASHLHELRAGTEEYAAETAKNRALEDVASRLGFEVVYVNLSEFHKGGALLSRMVMHLNRHSYRLSLL